MLGRSSNACGIVADHAGRVERHELILDEGKGRQWIGCRLRDCLELDISITTAKPVVIMHPTLADLCNKDVTNYARPDGKQLFVGVVILANEQGQDVVGYMGRLPDRSKPVPRNMKSLPSLRTNGLVARLIGFPAAIRIVGIVHVADRPESTAETAFLARLGSVASRLDGEGALDRM